MFKYWAIKKYCKKLLPKLQSRYGFQKFYTASQVRATVYQCDFNPTYLPLGYILHLSESDQTKIIELEFPDICINSYKKDIVMNIENRSIENQLSQFLT